MALQMMICCECGSRFEAVRSDAETCSGRCRARVSRKRREEAQVREIARAVEVLTSLRAAAAILPAD